MTFLCLFIKVVNYIKIYADNGAKNGDIWLTGSQRLPLMQGVTESLAGRVGIIDLQGLSANEINGTDNTALFLPEVELLFNRMNHAKKQSLKEIYQLIWHGSMPVLCTTAASRTGKAITPATYKPFYSAM